MLRRAVSYLVVLGVLLHAAAFVRHNTVMLEAHVLRASLVADLMVFCHPNGTNSVDPANLPDVPVPTDAQERLPDLLRPRLCAGAANARPHAALCRFRSSASAASDRCRASRAAPRDPSPVPRPSLPRLIIEWCASARRLCRGRAWAIEASGEQPSMSLFLSPTTQSICARHVRSIVTLLLSCGAGVSMWERAHAQSVQQLPGIVIESEKAKKKAARQATPAKSNAAAPQAQPAAPAADVSEIGGDPRGSLTVPTTAQIQTDLAKVPGAVVVVPDTAYKSSTPAATIKDVLDYVPGVFAQPKWGEDTRLSIRGSSLSRNFHLRSIQLYHERHSAQYRRRLWRFPGDRSERLSLRRGLQGRKCAALRRQFARRRHQLRDAHRSRRKRHVGECRHRQLRLPPPPVERCAARMGRSISSSPAPGRSRTASATTAGVSPPVRAAIIGSACRRTSRRGSSSASAISCSASRAA